MTDQGKENLAGALERLDEDWRDWNDREGQILPEESFKTPAPIKQFIATHGQTSATPRRVIERIDRFLQQEGA